MSSAPPLAASSGGATVCQLCRKTLDDATRHTCTSCRTSMCDCCTAYQYPNRLHAGICTRCPVNRGAFPCGRCGCLIDGESFEFFCDMCAEPLCATCLWSSFECGQLKCARCCHAPVVSRLRTSGAAPSILTPQVLLSVLPGGGKVAARQDSGAVLPTASHGGGGDCARGGVGAGPAPAAASSKYVKLLDRRELGEGAQAKVYKCRTTDGEVVVSKEMIFDDFDRASLEAQLRQAMRMKQLNHHHLIRYLDVYADYNPPCLHVIMPYYDEGDLADYIRHQRAPVDEWRLCSLILQIDIALEYLHSQDPPLVHRDVKPENVLLLNQKEQVLLMDLDICRSVDTTASIARTAAAAQLGTFEYMAPELEHSMGSPKSDIFSLGVVMYYLAVMLPDSPMTKLDSGETGVLSGAFWTPAALEAAIRRDLRIIATKSYNPYTYSEGFTALLVDMLRHDPAKRPSSTAVKMRLEEIMSAKLLGSG